MHLDEFIKHRAVLDHRSPQVLCACFIFARPRRDPLRRAVVFHQARMADGEIRGTLSKIAYWIAARLDERREQLIGFRWNPPKFVVRPFWSSASYVPRSVERFVAEWYSVQSRFVDHPKSAAEVAETSGLRAPAELFQDLVP
jgi:hypothetical protein